MATKFMECIERIGFGVYVIDGGKMEPYAQFCIADPSDDNQGFYLEADTMTDLVDEWNLYYDGL